MKKIKPETMTRKEEIIESVEYIFENTKRIHGNSEALDWQKIAIHKSVDYILSLPIHVPSEEEINMESQMYLPRNYESTLTEAIIIAFRGGHNVGAQWAINEILKRNGNLSL